jgi:rhodanese-related sulfurtransferase
MTMRALSLFLPLLAALMIYTLPQARAEKPFAPDRIDGVTIVDAAGVIELIYSMPELTIIDSRLVSEYEKGHIEGALHLLDTDMSEQTLTRIVRDHDLPILFYCNGERCLRSANAIEQAISYGYSNLYWFRSGWQEWLDLELPITH